MDLSHLGLLRLHQSNAGNIVSSAVCMYKYLPV